MTVVLWIAATMLALAAGFAVIRIVRGPSPLDRVVAMDVLLSCLIAAIGLEAAYHRHGTTLPVLAVLGLLGFVGAVAVARFGAGVDPDEDGGRAGRRMAASRDVPSGGSGTVGGNAPGGDAAPDGGTTTDDGAAR